MRLKTFRSRIILTVVAVVSLFSSVAFYVYSNYLTKRIFKNTEENTSAILGLINEPNRLTSAPHNSNDFEDLIYRMLETEQIKNAYFIDSDEKLKYPANIDKDKEDAIYKTILPLNEDQLSFVPYKSGKNTYTRAYVRIRNLPECTVCHSNNKANLGYVIFDFTINQTEKNINFTRRFSVSFTVFLVILLGSFVILMHYRFVKTSLSKFKNSILKINHGNLNERVSISNSKELGELAVCFNLMIDNFQKTTEQLNNYHEKELQDAQKLATIGEMSARLAHEIRNPITGIANAIEIIVENTDNDQHKPILEEIRRQARRVNEAISKLLKYSGNEELKMETHDINESVKSIVFFLKNQSGTGRITFAMELQAKIPMFKFDKEKIENAIMNLGLNAMQAIENRGVVTFFTSYNSSENTVEIIVEDNGVGIPKNKVKEIFKPFYTTKTEGTGLGLVIIKDTVEKHNGRVIVESEEGVGTKIRVVIPFEKE
jgi:signal transduction histidine kinase